MSDTSRAATAIPSRALDPALAPFLLVFDNGSFSEFGTFSISDWLGHTPADVLARNFGQPASTFADFPKKEVYIATGPVPSPLPADPSPGSQNEPPLTHRYRLLAAKPSNSSAARCAACLRPSSRFRPP
jgi:hypothetical protein